MKNRNVLSIAAVLVFLVMATAAANAVVPADHLIRELIAASATPEDAGRVVLNRFLQPAMETTGMETCDIQQVNTDGNKVMTSTRHLVRSEVNNAMVREVTIHYPSTDRVYRDTVTRDGVWSQALKRGSRGFREIAASGRVNDTAYQMADLQEHFEMYEACLVVGTDNNFVQLECVEGPYPRLRVNLDLVNDQLVIVYKTMYNDRGQIMKTEKRGEFTSVAGKPRPQVIVMVDHGEDLELQATYDDIRTDLLLEWRKPTPLEDVNDL